MNRCKNCYWYRFEDIIWGYCWRFPPKKIVDKLFPKIKYSMFRPEVLEESPACGEFKDLEYCENQRPF